MATTTFVDLFRRPWNGFFLPTRSPLSERRRARSLQGGRLIVRERYTLKPVTTVFYTFLTRSEWER